MIVTSLLSAGLLVVADLQRTNRVLIEDTLERMKALQYGEASREEVMLGCGSREDAACAHDDAASGGEGAAHGDEDGDEGGAHGDGRDAARRGETRPAPGGAVQLEPGGNARHAPGGPI